MANPSVMFVALMFILSLGGCHDDCREEFLSATGNGDLSKLEHLIDAIGDVNFIAFDGDTPLGAAARNGNLSIVLFLLDHGANVNFEDVSGGTPLSWALYDRHLDIAELLAQRGATFSDSDIVNESFLRVVSTDEAVRKWMDNHGYHEVAR